MELAIWLGDELVAHTHERGERVSIVYTDAVVERLGYEIPLLSCSLPTPGPSAPAKARAFLEGLLPEGHALDAMAANLRGVRLQDRAPATLGDAVNLLAQYGRECAGAVAIAPADANFEPTQGRYQPIGDRDLARIIRELPSHPLGADPDRDVRMSLAGAQSKFLLARFDDRWFEPVDGAASTHILKPTDRWPYSAQNEALVMNLARDAGLTHTATWVEPVENTSVLVVERFDRRIVGDARVTRIHQEDLCQALGLRPIDKYHVGRPSEKIARLLRRLSDAPVDDVREVFRQAAFRVIVGDEDGHGKNYSVLLQGGGVRLAPLYDSLCTLFYPELSGRLATAIGRQSTLAGVNRTALLEEAAAMGIEEKTATGVLDGLAASLSESLGRLDAQLTRGWPSDQVIDIVQGRLQRLRTDEPLGRPRTTSRPGAPDMTEQTASPIDE